MGPSHSVEQVLDQYGSALFRLGYFMLGSSADTEDAVQDTLIRYLQKHPQFADNEHEKAWLLRVMTNRCRDLLRWRARHPQVDLDELRHLAAPDENSNILAALMRLPPKLRLVMTLHYIEGYSVSEIAPMIGRTPSAVKMRLQKGRRHCGGGRHRTGLFHSLRALARTGPTIPADPEELCLQWHPHGGGLRPAGGQHRPALSDYAGSGG